MQKKGVKNQNLTLFSLFFWLYQKKAVYLHANLE